MNVCDIMFLAGNLRFANVEAKDDLGGKHFVCNSQNAVLRGLVQGDDHVVKPKPYPGQNTTLYTCCTARIPVIQQEVYTALPHQYPIHQFAACLRGSVS